MVSSLDLDAALDRRDRPAFEEAWNSAFDALRAEEGTLDAGALESLDALRARVYTLVYAATEHPEFAGAVSDDIGLIAVAAALRVQDSFVACLYERYLGAQLPVDAVGSSA